MERMINLAKALDDERLIEKIEQLEEENKKLKSDLAYERTMLDNVRAEYENLQDVNKKLKEKRIFSLGEYDYMILTSTTPQLKIIKKKNKGDSTFTIDGFTAIGKTFSSLADEEDLYEDVK